MAEVNTVPKEKKSVNKSGYIYLLQVYPNDTENTYKLGRTKNFTNRYSAYTKNKPTIKLFIEAPDDKKAERELLKLFDEKFTKRPDTGREYYNGDVNEMMQIVLNYFINDKNIFDEKKDSIDTDSNDMTAEQSEDYYNNDITSLDCIYDSPVNIGKDTPLMSIYDGYRKPDFRSKPAIEKVFKVANKFAKHIQKVVSTYFETKDFSYYVDYNLFKKLLEQSPGYVEYAESQEIIDMILVRMSGYKRPVDFGDPMNFSFHGSRVNSIKGLKIKGEYIYNLCIDDIYLNTTTASIMEQFKKKYNYKVVENGIVGINSKTDESDNININDVYKLASFIRDSGYFNRIPIDSTKYAYGCIRGTMRSLWKYLYPSDHFHFTTGATILACFILGCKMDSPSPPNIKIGISLNLNNENLRAERIKNHIV